MQWTVRLEARTSAGEVRTTELAMFSRPAVVSTLAEIGLMLDETKVLLARLQASVLWCFRSGPQCWTGGLATKQSSSRRSAPGF